jgi:signal transduction histidine kinase
MNKILERQLRKNFPGYPDMPKEFSHIWEIVSQTYDDFDNDRMQVERSAVISSREIEEGNIKQTESLHLLQSTIDAVESAIVVTYEEKLVIHNHRYAEIWHFPNELLEKRDMAKLLAHVQEQLADASSFVSRTQLILNETQTKSVDVLHTKDGRIIERRSYPMLINAGKLARVWVITDITELENAKRATMNLLEDLEHEKNLVEEKVKERTTALLAEHARFVASTSSIPLGFLVLDTANNILIKNNAVQSTFNISEKDYTLADIDRALPGVGFSEKIARCIQEHLPVEIKDVDVANKILRILISPMRGVEGGDDLLGVVLLVEDTTEARSLERGRDEFFAIASHELRTPLTAIRGNMSIIEDYYKESITDPEVIEMIKDTNSAASRLITIVNDFLDVSRLEQGHVTFSATDFSAEKLVTEVVSELKEVGLKKNITIASECPIASLCMVYADYDRSKQVLMNLVSNAVNYSVRGSVHICASVEGEYLQFSVRDEGIGISPQNQTLLFRKFQQAGTNMLARDVTQSTGLGLYISRLIVEPMGGKIWLKQSTAGEGSEFAFTLPLSTSTTTV